MMKNRVVVTVRGVAPTDGLGVFVCEESIYSAVLDLVAGHATGLILVPVCELVEGAVTVAPVGIVRKSDLVEEKEPVVS